MNSPLSLCWIFLASFILGYVFCRVFAPTDDARKARQYCELYSKEKRTSASLRHDLEMEQETVVRMVSDRGYYEETVAVLTDQAGGTGRINLVA